MGTTETIIVCRHLVMEAVDGGVGGLRVGMNVFEHSNRPSLG